MTIQNRKTEEKKNPIQVSERIFQVLETLAGSEPMGLMELSKELDLNKSTVHRILNSLIYMGYVKQEAATARYSLTFKIWDLANQLLNKMDIVDLARPYLKKLVSLTGETVHLIQVDGIHAVYIDKIESESNSVRLVSRIGKSIPLYCSGVGKAILADLPDQKIQEIWEKSTILSLTEHTITDFNAFMKKIHWVRSSGYAIDDEENELGVRCIAASLPDYKGTSQYAFSISAPIIRMPDHRLEELSHILLKIKQEIMSEWK